MLCRRLERFTGFWEPFLRNFFCFCEKPRLNYCCYGVKLIVKFPHFTHKLCFKYDSSSGRHSDNKKKRLRFIRAVSPSLNQLTFLTFHCCRVVCLRLKTDCSRKTRKLGAMAERVSKMLIDWSAIDDLTECEERNFLVAAFIASAGDALFAKSNATKFSLLLHVLKCRLKLLCLRSSCEASYLTIKLLKISYSSRNFINFNCNLELFNL